MLGLPRSTELSKQLSKKAIYTKFNMNTASKSKFDADISKIFIVHEISPTTTVIEKGKAVTAIYVLSVTLKRKDYAQRTIEQISKLIDQNMLLILHYEDEIRLAIYHTKLIQSEWKSAGEASIKLKGLNLDNVWENIVVQVGGIRLDQGNSLNEQIISDEKKQALQRQIDKLEKQARTEKQPKKKFETVQELNDLKKKLEII